MFPDIHDSKREQAEDALDQGIDLLEQGDEEEAGRCFFKSIEVDPTYADGYNHLANIDSLVKRPVANILRRCYGKVGR